MDDALKQVAALFVDHKGTYPMLPGVECWDAYRDARLYPGPYPVVAHPPCAAWCRLAGLREAVYGLPRGEDGGCFESALASVRRFGGVLEHPAYSDAWAKFALPNPIRPRWQQVLSGEWVCEVSQAAYGHRARKLTWLLYIGSTPPAELDWSRPQWSAVVSGSNNKCSRPARGVQRVYSREASRTPLAFAQALVELARQSRVCR